MWHVYTWRKKYGQNSNDSPLPGPKVVSFNLYHCCFSEVRPFTMARKLKAGLFMFCGQAGSYWAASLLFQQVNFVASQRLVSQISTMGIIPPSLCWSFHWLGRAMQLHPEQGGVGGSRLGKVSWADSLWPSTKNKNKQTNQKTHLWRENAWLACR